MHKSLIKALRHFLKVPVRGFGVCTGASAMLGLMFLTIAVWNGFPLVFYDTGAYVLEGLGHIFLVERAPVYSDLLFLAGGRFSLWPIVIFQALLTGYVIVETARAELGHVRLGVILAIGVVLTALTGIAWYVGQVEPDCMTPLVILGFWLLVMRSHRLGGARSTAVAVITGLAVACHPSHLGLIAGLLILAAVLKLVVWSNPAGAKKRRLKGHARPIASAKGPHEGSVAAPAKAQSALRLPDPKLGKGLLALAISLFLMIAGNFALTGTIFLSKSGSVFVFARLMQDGIVKRLLAQSCPPKGKADYRLCEYKDHLARTANGWLWGNSEFRALGGFTDEEQQEEDRRIIVDSLKRYPLMNLRAAIYDSVLQFAQFKTGDGIEPQLSILEPGFRRMIPAQLSAYLHARQQEGKIRFKVLNLIHVPVGAMSLLGLLLLIQHAVRRLRWNEAVLPALVLSGLIGNAIICGTFSNPHDRYQSRIMWLPTLVLLLAMARDRHALQPVPESGT